MPCHLLLIALATSALFGAPAATRSGRAASPSRLGGPARTPPAPRLEATLEQDLGEAMSGTPLQVSFPIRNVGTAPLKITRVTPECRCMVSRYDRRLAPGARGAIHVTYETTGRHGTAEKHLTVESNDPAQPVIMLTLKVVLRQVVEVSPGERVRVPSRPGEVAEQELILRSYEKTPLQVTRVLCSSPTTQSRLLSREEVERRMPENPSAFQIVQITFPASATSKAYEETVTIDTNSAVRPTIPVRLTRKLLKAFSARPARLDFGPVSSKGGVPTTHVFDLLRQWGQFKVLSTEVPDPCLQVRVEPDASGALFHVVVVYDGGWQPGKVAGAITIRTDDPWQPAIRVPYTAQVSAGSG